MRLKKNHFNILFFLINFYETRTNVFRSKITIANRNLISQLNYIYKRTHYTVI